MKRLPAVPSQTYFPAVLVGMQLVVSRTTGFAGGDGVSLKVRGFGSINNSDPLIVVDGMPDVDINRINMNDIESISVS